MPSRPGSRVMNSCPYNDCPGGSNLSASSLAASERRPDHKLMRCPTCEGFSVMIPTGFVFPLADASNPDADVVVATSAY